MGRLLLAVAEEAHSSVLPPRELRRILGKKWRMNSEELCKRGRLSDRGLPVVFVLAKLLAPPAMNGQL